MDNELAFIIPLLKEIEYFKQKELTKLQFEEIAKNVKYEVREPGQTIFNILDEADHFYIVLKGKVMVQISDPLDNNFIDKIHANQNKPLVEPPKK